MVTSGSEVCSFHCRWRDISEGFLPVLCRYLPDDNDGHDVTVNRADRIRAAATPRDTEASPGARLVSLPHDSLRGARTVHGDSRDRLLRMRTAEHLQLSGRVQSTTI